MSLRMPSEDFSAISSIVEGTQNLHIQANAGSEADDRYTNSVNGDSNPENHQDQVGTISPPGLFASRCLRQRGTKQISLTGEIELMPRFAEIEHESSLVKMLSMPGWNWRRRSLTNRSAVCRLIITNLKRRVNPNLEKSYSSGYSNGVEYRVDSECFLRVLKHFPSYSCCCGKCSGHYS